jgi:hypothetical protein
MVEDMWPKMALNYELQVTVKQKKLLKNDFEASTNITGSKIKDEETSYSPEY